MVVPLDEPFLESDGNIRSASIIGVSRTDQSKIIAPGMNEDISSRDDDRSTVQSDAGKANKMDAAVQLSLSNEWNAATSRIV